MSSSFFFAVTTTTTTFNTILYYLLLISIITTILIPSKTSNPTSTTQGFFVAGQPGPKVQLYETTQYGTVVYLETFSGGNFSAHNQWTSRSYTQNGQMNPSSARIDINTLYTTNGEYALIMDSTDGVMVRNDAQWEVDLRPFTGLTLFFDTVSFGDEATSDMEGVLFSSGALSSWTTAWNPIDINGKDGWNMFCVSISAMDQNFNLSVTGPSASNPKLAMSFSQFDDLAIPFDGRGYKNIYITASNISMTHAVTAPDPLYAGNQISFTTTVENRSPVPVTASFKHQYSPQITITSYSLSSSDTYQAAASMGACTIDNTARTMLCNLNVSASGSITVSMPAQIDSYSFRELYQQPGTLNSTVKLLNYCSYVLQRNLTNVRTLAAYQITDVISPPNVIAGTQQAPGYSASCNFPVTIKVKNNGPSLANRVAWKLKNSINVQAALSNLPVRDINVGSTEQFYQCFSVLQDSIGTARVTIYFTSTTTDTDESDNEATIDVPILTESDLVMLKTQSEFTVNAGQILQVRFSYKNNGPSAARDVTITLSYPSFAQYADALPLIARFNGSVTVSVTSAVNANDVLCCNGTVSLLISSGAPTGNFAITMRVNSSTYDPNPSNNMQSITFTVFKLADVGLDMSQDPVGIVYAGSSFSYLLTVNNLGPSDATNLVVTETLPGVVSFSSVTASGINTTTSCSYDLPKKLLTCNLDKLAAGAEALLVVTSRVFPNTPISSYTSVARVAIAENDNISANNQATVQTYTGTMADLIVQVVLDPEEAVAGEPISCSMTVFNAGPSDASSITAYIFLPEVQFFGYNASVPENCSMKHLTGEIGCVQIPIVAVGSTLYINASMGLYPSSGGLLTFSANAFTTTSDPNTTNNAVLFSKVISKRAELSLAVYTSVQEAVAGDRQNISTNLVVYNNGPSFADSLLVWFLVPEFVSVVSMSSSCSFSENSRDLRCTNSSLGSLNSQSYSVVLTVRHNAIDGDLNITVNTTSVSKELDLVDNVATLYVRKVWLVTNVVLAVAQYNGGAKGNGFLPPAASAIAGTPLSFIATVSNSEGPSDARDVVLSFNATGLEFRSWAVVSVGSNRTSVNCFAAGVSSNYSLSLECHVPVLPLNTSLTLNLTTYVSPSMLSSVFCSLNLTMPMVNDTNPNDNVAVLETPIVGLTELVLESSTGDANHVVAGEVFVVRSVVSNAEGPSDAQQVIYRSTFPYGAILNSTFVPQGTCTFNHSSDFTNSTSYGLNGTIECQLGTVPFGARLELEFRFLVHPGVLESTVLTVQNSISTTTALVSESIVASTISMPVLEWSDLLLHVSSDRTNITAGTNETLSVALTVANGGPSFARNISVEGVVSMPVLNASVWTPYGGNSCTITAAATNSTSSDVTTSFSCSVGDILSLDPNALKTIYLSMSLPYDAVAAVLLYSFTVWSSVSSSLGENRRCANGTTTVLSVADLSTRIFPADEVSIAYAGEEYNYTISVVNNGPSKAWSVSSITVLPSTVRFVSAYSYAISNFDQNNCNLVAGIEGSTGDVLSCVIGNLDPSSVNIRTNFFNYTVTVLMTHGGLVDFAIHTTVNSSITLEPAPSNNKDVVVTTPYAKSDLSIQILPVYNQSLLQYKIVASNAGPSDATSVNITFAMPTPIGRTSFVSAPTHCVHQDGVVHCLIQYLEVDQFVALGIELLLLDTENATLFTSAFIYSNASIDLYQGTNSANSTTDVADLSLMTHAEPKSTIAGEVLTYYFNICNFGPAPEASLVRVVGTLDSRSTWVVPSLQNSNLRTNGDADCSASGLQFNCVFTSVSVSQPSMLIVAVLVDSDARGTLNTSLTISSFDGFDFNLANNSYNVLTPIFVDARFAVVVDQVRNPSYAPWLLIYSIRITNLGPSVARNVTLKGTIPIGASFVSVSPSSDCFFEGALVTCFYPRVITGSTLSIQLSVRALNDSIPAAAATELINNVHVLCPSANVDTTMNTTTPVTDLSVELSKSSAAVATAGETFVYAVQISNLGLIDASNVDFVLTLGSGSTHTSPINITGASSCTLVQGDSSSLRCSLATNITAGGSSLLHIPVRVDPWQTSDIAAHVLVSLLEYDRDISNNNYSISVSVQTVSDLSLTLQTDVSPAVSGLQLSYIATVRNAGPSATRRFRVGVALPANNVTFSSYAVTSVGQYTASCSINCTGTILFFLDNLAAGVQSSAVTVRLTVHSGAMNSLSCNASVEPMAHPDYATPFVVLDPNVSNNYDSLTTPLDTSSDLLIVWITQSPSPSIAGQNATFNIRFGNDGPSDSRGTSLVIVLPSTGLTFQSAITKQVGASCDYAPQTLTVSCNFGSVQASATVDVFLIAQISPAAVTALLPITAQVSSSTADPDPSNNDGNLTPAVTQIADMAITLMNVSRTSVVSGDRTHVLVGINSTNLGPSEPQSASITTSLPPGVTWVRSDDNCALVSGSTSAISCTLGYRAIGDVAYSSFVFTIDPPTYGTLQISATISSSAESDADSSNNVQSVSTVANLVADLFILSTSSISDGSAVVTAGSSQVVYFNSIISNTGPSIPADVVVINALPHGTKYVSSSPAGGCVYNATLHTAACPIGALAISQVASVSIGIRVDSATTTNITNTATVSSAGSYDVFEANNTHISTVGVITSADLQISSISSNPNPAVAGSVLAYSVSVYNPGPSDSLNVSIAQYLPSTGLTAAAATTTRGSCATDTSAMQATCVVASLPALQSVTFTTEVTVDSHYNATLPFLLNVTALTSDFNSTNNQASIAPAVIKQADLAAVLSVSNANPVAGVMQEHTLIVQATNIAGPSSPHDVALVIDLPAGVTFSSISRNNCIVHPTGAPTHISCLLGVIDPAQTLSTEVNFTVDATSYGTLQFSASISSSAQDLTSSNNNAAVSITAVQQSDFSATITSSLATVVAGAGERLVLTANMTNNGPSVPSDPTMVFTLPTGITFIDYALAAPLSGGTCTFNSATNKVSCSLAPISVGKSSTVNVTIVVNDYVATNISAWVDVGSVRAADLVPTNNIGNQSSIRVNVVSDISVQFLTNSHQVAVSGTNFVYQWLVTNFGPSVATGIIADFILPADTSLVATIPTTRPAGTTASFSNSSSVLSWSLSKLPVGGQAVISATVAVPPRTLSSLICNASVSVPAGSIIDPYLSNNSASLNTSVATSADIKLDIMQPPVVATVLAGGNVTYVVSVLNTGPSDSFNVMASVPVPAGTTFVRAVVSTQNACLYSTSMIQCPLGNLLLGTTASVTIDLIVTPQTRYAVNFTASTNATTTDPIPGNNAKSLTTSVIAQSNLGLTMRIAPNDTVAGDSSAIALYLVLSNEGPSIPLFSRVRILLPPGAVYSSSSHENCTAVAGPIVTCTVHSISVGTTVPLNVTYTVDPNAIGVLTQNASVVSVDDAWDPDTSNNEVRGVNLNVTQRADIGVAVSSSVSSTIAGNQQNVTFRMTVTNYGVSSPADVVLNASISAGTTFITMSSGSSNTSCAFYRVTNSISCQLGRINVNAFVSVNATFIIDASTTANITFKALAYSASNAVDPNPQNNNANITVVTATLSDLHVVAIEQNKDPVVAGTQLQYVVIIVNNGPSDAYMLVANDVLPAEVSFVSSTIRGGTGNSSCSHMENSGASTIICTATTLPAGQLLEINITTNVNPLALGAIVNTANVGSLLTPEANTTDNSKRNYTTVVQVSDLVIESMNLVALSSSSGPAITGSNTSTNISVVVANHGPSHPSDVTLFVTIPIGVTFVSGSPCQPSGTSLLTIVCQLNTIAVESPAVANLSVIINPDVDQDQLVFLANVTSLLSWDNALLNNNSTVVLSLSRIADFAATITTNFARVVAGAGQRLTFTTTLWNYGPSAPANISLVNRLPDGIAHMSTILHSDDNSGRYCSVLGHEGIIICNFSRIDVGESIIVNTTVAVLSSTVSDLSSTVWIVSPNANDPEPSNNEASAIVIVDRVYDLELSLLRSDPPQLISGTPFTFQFTVRNYGPSIAKNCSISIAAPGVVKFLNVSTNATIANSGSTNIQSSSGSLQYTFPVIADGSSLVVEIHAFLDPFVSENVLLYGASIASEESAVTDPIVENNAMVASSPIANIADLVLNFTQNSQIVQQTDLLVFTMNVTNFGPSSCHNVTLLERLPHGVSVISIVPSLPHIVCSNVGARTDGEITCAMGRLDPLLSVWVVVSVRSLPSTFDPLVSSVTIHDSAAQDPNPTNNNATSTALVDALANIAVIITQDGDNNNNNINNGTAVAGGNMYATIQVNNYGPNDARNSSLLVQFPNGTTLGTYTYSNSYNHSIDCVVSLNKTVLLCALYTLPYDGSASISVVLDISPASVGPVVTCASVESSVSDPISANNVYALTTLVLAKANLILIPIATSTSSLVVAGTRLDLAYTIMNKGPSDSAQVVLKSVLASGVTFSSFNSSKEGITCAITNDHSHQQLVVCTYRQEAPVPAGDVLSFIAIVTNSGPSMSAGASLFLALPNECDVVINATSSPMEVSCATVTMSAPARGIILKCDLGTLHVNAPLHVTINTRTAASVLPQTITTIATTNSSTEDPSLHDNEAVVSTQLTTLADLSIVTNAQPATVAAGAFVSLITTITNFGPSNCLRASFQTGLLSYASMQTLAAPAAGSCTVYGLSDVNCTFHDIIPGVSIQINITYLIDPSLTTTSFTQRAVVTSVGGTPDVVSSNNYYQLVVPIYRTADLGVMVTDNPSTVQNNGTTAVAGTSYIFTATVFNYGPSTADVSLTDTLTISRCLSSLVLNRDIVFAVVNANAFGGGGGSGSSSGARSLAQQEDSSTDVALLATSSLTGSQDTSQTVAVTLTLGQLLPFRSLTVEARLGVPSELLNASQITNVVSVSSIVADQAPSNNQIVSMRNISSVVHSLGLNASLFRENNPNSNISISVTVNNGAGPSAAHDLIITLLLPHETLCLDVLLHECACSQPQPPHQQPTARCVIDLLMPGESVTFETKLQIVRGSYGVLNIFATLESQTTSLRNNNNISYGVLNTTSLSFVADDSPPTAGVVLDVGVGRGPKYIHSNDSEYQTSTSSLSVHWAGFDDDLSLIRDFECGVSSFDPAPHDQQQPAQPDVADFVRLPPTSTNCTLDGLSLVPGRKYFVLVRSTNHQNLSTTVSSNGIVIDDRPPRIVRNNTSTAVVVPKWQSTVTETFTGSWHGAFSDHETTIREYFAGIGTMPTITDVLPAQSVGNVTSFVFNATTTDGHSLLRQGQLYYLVVWAVDLVGLESDSLASEPVLIDSSPPVGQVFLRHNKVVGGLLEVSWFFEDLQSGIVKYELGITMLPETDFFNFPLRELNVSAITNNTLILDFINAPELRGVPMFNSVPYYVVMRVTNGVGTTFRNYSSAFTSTDSTTSFLNVSKEETRQLTVVVAHSNITLIVQPGSLPTEDNIHFKYLTAEDFDAPNATFVRLPKPSTFSRYVPVTTNDQLTFSLELETLAGGYIFEKPMSIQITLPLRSDHEGGAVLAKDVDLNKLSLMYFDTTNRVWRRAYDSCLVLGKRGSETTVGNTHISSVCHFTQFALFGENNKYVLNIALASALPACGMFLLLIALVVTVKLVVRHRQRRRVAMLGKTDLFTTKKNRTASRVQSKYAEQEDEEGGAGGEAKDDQYRRYHVQDEEEEHHWLAAEGLLVPPDVLIANAPTSTPLPTSLLDAGVFNNFLDASHAEASQKYNTVGSRGSSTNRSTACSPPLSTRGSSVRSSSSSSSNSSVDDDRGGGGSDYNYSPYSSRSLLADAALEPSASLASLCDLSSTRSRISSSSSSSSNNHNNRYRSRHIEPSPSVSAPDLVISDLQHTQDQNQKHRAVDIELVKWPNPVPPAGSSSFFPLKNKLKVFSGNGNSIKNNRIAPINNNQHHHRRALMRLAFNLDDEDITSAASLDRPAAATTPTTTTTTQETSDAAASAEKLEESNNNDNNALLSILSIQTTDSKEASGTVANQH